ncbi:MAG TPA: L,D-transpeptidase family protein [Flavisolibacter sp.]|jgi:murein L,D-transpeptidase YcbB/YkuD|nr:L,D-transpeptidase family protein [Flavisolibacter sp.]
MMPSFDFIRCCKNGILLVMAALLFACNEHVHVGEKEIVATPEQINSKAEEVIQGTLKDVLQGSSDTAQSFGIKNAGVLKSLYEDLSYQPIWSAKGHFYAWGDSLFQLIDSARYRGLFPEDYHQEKLKALQQELTLDTSKENKLDAAKWAYCDLLLSSAFVQFTKDLKKGRLLPDSVLSRDSTLTLDFYKEQLTRLKDSGVTAFADQLEPRHQGYQELKEALAGFIRQADFRTYTSVRSKDSMQLRTLLYKRLSEEDSLQLVPLPNPDSLQMSSAIRRYQEYKKIKADGKYSSALIARLNNTDLEKFIRIAITLDRYKSLEPLPEQYIWVNIPSYFLQVREGDSVVLTSKVVVGKPVTKTPVITSSITDMITYPKWHIPESIIKKDILPGLKRDPGYTIRKGFMLVDQDNNEVDPYSVNWSKYTNGIPYSVIQGSGDDNALGVIKFNFPNKHSVYLHDTNQRYLFSRSSRALSHGCVRVESWQKLSAFLLRNDSAFTSAALPVDSLNQWLMRKEKHVIPVRKRVPLFIRYFTCEAKDGAVVFYEDVYGEDRSIRDKIFSTK